MGVYNVGALSAKLNVLSLGKSEVYRIVVQPFLKDLYTRLTCLQVLLCHVFAFFLTLVLIYLERSLQLSLQSKYRYYTLIDIIVLYFKDCAYFTKEILIIVQEITVLRIGGEQYSLDMV